MLFPSASKTIVLESISFEIYSFVPTTVNFPSSTAKALALILIGSAVLMSALITMSSGEANKKLLKIEVRRKINWIDLCIFFIPDS